jgi:hypothetical protein
VTRVLVILALACGCARHPAVTVAVAAGSVGLLSCAVNETSPGTCLVIGGGAAAVLGGITALVTYFADTSAHELPPDQELLPSGVLRVRTHTEPPPVQADAGVPESLPRPATAAVDAAVDAAVPESPDATR